ncbi:MAG TPA: molybdopterin biosynthesis protein, partial [Desulfobacteraceae bacterium]|nr:molybdopterin biosynthesis protein [Desulfobacteraceae bacterium]
MNFNRNIYLQMKTLEKARKILFEQFSVSKILSGEKVSVPDAVGRVLHEPATAQLSSPNFHAAAMDGIAVKAETTFGISETKPQKLIIGKDAFYVNTGQPLP